MKLIGRNFRSSSMLLPVPLLAIFCLARVQAQLQTPNNVCAANPPNPLKLSGPFSTCAASVKNILSQRHPDQNKLTVHISFHIMFLFKITLQIKKLIQLFVYFHKPQVLATYNYPFKAYSITTKDDYILTVYRITGSPNSKKKSNGPKQAVYLNHGLGGASDNWNFQPGSRNLRTNFDKIFTNFFQVSIFNIIIDRVQN
ncbi:unnamed protein product [Orchesella dallaii]|uniref:Partial AB-hydrolase lipase domain-containing protein n=1 Tax=Orchesella dallaii TaxID=48710 RepID=A0ABP1RSB2_9HEXA